MLFACFGVSIDVFPGFSYSYSALAVLVLVLEDTASSTSTSTISLSTSTIKAKTAQLQSPTARDLNTPCSSHKAYAHRQGSVALWAETTQPDLYGRSTTQQPRSLRESHILCAFAPSRLCVPFFQQPRSLREIHTLCVFAPLRLCVLFFQQPDLFARSTTNTGRSLAATPQNTQRTPARSPDTACRIGTSVPSAD